MRFPISKYTRAYEYTGGSVILYNTATCETIEIDKHYLNSSWTEIDISRKDPLYQILKGGEFLSHIVPMEPLLNRYKFSTLILSLETFLSCNLKCPYCYQTNTHLNRGVISDSHLNLLYDYVVKVFQRTKFTTLILKVLGGDPSINFKPAATIIRLLSKFCERNGIVFRLKIDTNATIIKDFIKLNPNWDISFTIPLTYKNCHNKYRFFNNHEGTYNVIINNCINLKKNLPNANIIFRYNLDHENIDWFEDYIVDLKSKIKFSPIITAQFTTDPEFGIYNNKLTYQQYVDFMSTSYIDILSKYDLPISIVPMYLIGNCQRHSLYSIKLFSDGKVGACAMDFFKNDNPPIKELVDNIDKITFFWGKAKVFSLFNNSKCLNCESIFVCGGHYNLDCIKELNIPVCKPETSLYLNLESFAIRLHKLRNMNKEHLFIGINNLRKFK